MKRRREKHILAPGNAFEKAFYERYAMRASGTSERARARRAGITSVFNQFSKIFEIKLSRHLNVEKLIIFPCSSERARAHSPFHIYYIEILRFVFLFNSSSSSDKKKQRLRSTKISWQNRFIYISIWYITRAALILIVSYRCRAYNHIIMKNQTKEDEPTTDQIQKTYFILK